MNIIDSSIFKTYDIRGIYPSEINEQIAESVGKAFSCLLKKDTKKNDVSIVIASDMRISSPQLRESLIKGLMNQGAKIIDIGLSSSPTFYFAVAHYDYDGGILVTASHNPAEYNGFKMVRKQAIPLSKKTGITDVKELIEHNDFPKSQSGTLIKKNDVLIEHVIRDLTYINTDIIKEFTIVADPANSMGALYIEQLFSHMPVKFVKMNFDLDGSFPAHQADPFDEKNLKDLKKRVIREQADMGIATDGDGDRLFLIDNKGEVVPPHILRGILAKPFLKDFPGSNIVYDIRPGKITKDIIEEFGGKPIVSKVGHSLIKEKMREVNAVYAGESSGHYFLRFDHGYYEAPMIMIGKILEELSSSNLTLSELVQPHKKYAHSGEINSKVKNPTEKIKEITSEYEDAIKINTLDGVTIEYESFWFNIRASNTEPLLRLTVEAKTKEIMEMKKEELLKIIRS